MSRFAHNTRGNFILFTMLMLCALCRPAACAASREQEGYSEESVKAAFVFRFVGYVRWPRESLPPDRFVIAVLGADDIAMNLQSQLGGRLLQDRPVQVRRISGIGEAAGSQVLYVGKARRGNLRALLSPLAGRNMLIVTDEDAGLAAGSAINLMVVDQHVRFEISMAAARRAGLDISSDLLALAVRVQQ